MQLCWLVGSMFFNVYIHSRGKVTVSSSDKKINKHLKENVQQNVYLQYETEVNIND